MRINTGIPLSCVWLPIASRFKIFLHSVMESERLIVTIVALFRLIIAIRRVQQVWFFTLYFFWKEDSTLRCDCFPYKETDWEKKSELSRLASCMENMQTVKLSLDQKFTVYLETSSDSGALKWNEKKRKREEGFKCAVNMYKSLNNVRTQLRVKKNQRLLVWLCVYHNKLWYQLKKLN